VVEDVDMGADNVHHLQHRRLLHLTLKMVDVDDEARKGSIVRERSGARERVYED
jgi:hypothetical protein